MKKHPDFDYEIISREKDFFENKNKNIYDPVTKKHAKIVDVPFRYTSVKKLASELVVDPTLNLSREQYENIYRFKDTRFGEVKGLDQGQIFSQRPMKRCCGNVGCAQSPRGTAARSNGTAWWPHERVTGRGCKASSDAFFRNAG